MGFPAFGNADRLRRHESRRRAMAHVADHLSFATLADVERVVAERCRVLKDDPLRLGTNFHWWPKPVRPTSSAGNRMTSDRIIVVNAVQSMVGAYLFAAQIEDV